MQKLLARAAQELGRRGELPRTGHSIPSEQVESKPPVRCSWVQQSRRGTHPPVRPKLDPFAAIIDQILEEDRSEHKKRRHTAKRVHERLRDGHGFTGGITP